MQSTQIIPSTPTPPRRFYTFDSVNAHIPHRPLNSSPLATEFPLSSPTSSPVSAVQARRRVQFKCKDRVPSTPVSSTRSRVSAGAGTPRLFGSGGNRRSVSASFSSPSTVTGTPSSSLFGSLFGSKTTTDEQDERRKIIRQRFHKRCLERAADARLEAIKGKRSYLHSGSSEDSMMEDVAHANADGEGEEDDDVILQDELFRRIVVNNSRRQKHAYRVSYALEVGSSFDPDMEDPSIHESELREAASSFSSHPIPNDLEPPDEFDELEEYAAIADFEDLPVEDLFCYSDLSDIDNSDGIGVEMDVS